MFGSAKPTASLSSGLLARKGQARPAMRPQGFHGSPMNLEDLGWNDMGDPAPEPAAVAPIAPQVAVVVPAAPPPVLVERETLAEAIETSDPAEPFDYEAPAAVKSVSVATAQRLKREVAACKPRAAFTLRLDADRHLQLRLASATRNRSAQALVTDALDALLRSMPEVAALASQLPEVKAKRSSGGKR